MSQPDTDQDGLSEVAQSASLDGVRLTTCSLEDFKDLYWNEIAPCLEAEGIDPKSEKPTHQWFRDHDARSFLAALRRHHGRSFGGSGTKTLALATTMRATRGQQTIKKRSTPSRSFLTGENPGTVSPLPRSTRYGLG